MALTASAAWSALPLALLLAWWWDHRFGEPPAAWHPVAWLGRVLGPLGAALKRGSPAWAFVGGAVAWCACASALSFASWAAQSWLLDRLGLLAAPLLAAMLKPMFAWRMLHDEVQAVEQAFAGGLRSARSRLARLVSRDVEPLDDADVREAAIETLAENLNDSVVAPLFWFALFGLPGAVAYRFANTADAMWGYRDEWEWAGKFAARADDVLSWVPARLTALWLLVGVSTPSTVRPSTSSTVRTETVEALGAGIQGFEGPECQGPFDRLRANGGGFQGAPVEAGSAPMPGHIPKGMKTQVACYVRNLKRLPLIARLTPSPNGGWPMGAMALRLNVRLGKPGVYVLNPEGRAPDSRHVAQALSSARQAAGWALGSSALLAGVAGGGWWCAAVCGGGPWTR